MKLKYLMSINLVFIVLFSTTCFSQQVSSNNDNPISVDGPVCELPYTDTINDFKTGRRQPVTSRMENQSIMPCADFIVSYSGFPSNPITGGVGDAQIAFQFAVDIWSNLIDSSVPIRVNANFAPAAETNLGSASPAFYTTVATGETSPFALVLYPAALSEKINGQDSNGPLGTSVDINCNFNSNRNDWYFGTDANPPNDEFDFVTVVLHELGHGLGVAGFGTELNSGEVAIRRDASGNTISAASNHVSIWDTYIDGSIVDFFGADRIEPILDESEFPDPSTPSNDQLKFQLESESRLSINSPIAVNQNGGDQPTTQGGFFNSTTGNFEFNPGSSYSHLDEDTFNNTPHALMTPFSGRGEANHDPGDIVLGFMEDMGWSLCGRTLSTDTNILADDIKVSPNPFTESFIIELPASLSNQEFNVTIVDINGRVVLEVQETINNGKIDIANLSNLKNALYFLNLESTSSDLKITKKLIKK